MSAWRRFVAFVATGAATGAVLVAVVGADAACGSLCHPTSKSAALSILSNWCERYTQCDPKRGTTDACISTRMSIGQVPDESGCGASCSDDDSACHRSTCDQARVDACKRDALAMKCEAQVQGSIVSFPSGCDSCFR